MFILIGFKKIAIEFDIDARVAGKTKWNYFKLIDLAVEEITSFTIAPLRIATIIGIITAFISFIYTAFIIRRTFIYDIDIPGYASLICVVLFLDGV